MTKELMIAGYSIEDLKKQRAAIQKDANKVISDNIESATVIIQKILSTPSDEIDVESLAKQATEMLETAEVVAGVSGCTFYLPFREDGYGDSFANDLENMEDEDDDNIFDRYPALRKLQGQLESMEYDSCNWHSSRC